MLTIGLTGGIGSGKSTVSKFFEELGIPCCDADEFARVLTQVNSPALLEISELFGPEILDDQGQLNRHRLREIVFSQPRKRQQLEAILHPRVREKIQSWIDRQTASYGIISVPLLTENQNQYQFDRILVVELDPLSQKQRTAKRDNVDEIDVEAIIAAQANPNERRAIADDVINNNGDIDELQQQIRRLHEKYRRLAEVDNGTTN